MSTDTPKGNVLKQIQEKLSDATAEVVLTAVESELTLKFANGRMLDMHTTAQARVRSKPQGAE